MAEIRASNPYMPIRANRFDFRAIGYLTDDPAPEYARSLWGAKNLLALRAVLAEYKAIAQDAFKAIPKSEAEFAEWRRGLALEHKGTFAGEAWAKRWGMVLIPAIMLEASMVAEQFHVPWGCAFIRMRNLGRIKVKNGMASIAKAG